jgi:hypothetical protein
MGQNAQGIQGSRGAREEVEKRQAGGEAVMDRAELESSIRGLRRVAADFCASGQLNNAVEVERIIRDRQAELAALDPGTSPAVSAEAVEAICEALRERYGVDPSNPYRPERAADETCTTTFVDSDGGLSIRALTFGEVAEVAAGPHLHAGCVPAEAQAESYPHEPSIGQLALGGFGVFCVECSRQAGDYVYPCAVKTEWPYPSKVVPADGADDHACVPLAELAELRVLFGKWEAEWHMPTVMARACGERIRLILDTLASSPAGLSLNGEAP